MTKAGPQGIHDATSIASEWLVAISTTGDDLGRVPIYTAMLRST